MAVDLESAMRYASYEELDVFVRKHGEENIICVTHNEPLMKAVDPLTLTYFKSRLTIPKARQLDFYCAAWLKLPQSSPCALKVRDKG